ncbi:MAG: hypothetical protein A2163_09640 [Actinobacteria bacterium RBG_13_35_12]|nr:MAG: hypothetical protein A2163_09640 [Actinobacteria bacterium RBG_13_35_12]
MRKLLSLLMVIVALCIVLVNSAYATFAESIALLEVDTDPYFALALIVITAIAAIWGVKKLIKLGNRS